MIEDSTFNASASAIAPIDSILFLDKLIFVIEELTFNASASAIAPIDSILLKDKSRHEKELFGCLLIFRIRKFNNFFLMNSETLGSVQKSLNILMESII